MKKRLIVGLGNIGEKYSGTRHNIGFEVLDKLAQMKDAKFEACNFGMMVKTSHKGRPVLLLKPDTFMNLSGKAIKFWIQKENVLLDNLLVVTDDLNLPFGTIRLKAKGSDGGHNGLKSTQNELQTNKYPRFRFGIGNEFEKARQADFVLGEWTEEERQKLEAERLETSANAVLSFCFSGLSNTMNAFNGK